MGTIAENLVALQETKSNIKTAIESKGQDLTDVPFTQYAEKISAIQTGGGESEEILKSVLDGSVTSITIPDGVKKVSLYLFYENANFTNVEFPDGLEVIGDYAFKKCNLGETLIIPNSVTTIGSGAFAENLNLKHCDLPTSLTTLGAQAFRSCDLREITFPSSLTEVGGNFIFGNNVNLISVTIPKTLQFDASANTRGYTFDGCTGLTNVTMEEGFTQIGYGMFQKCTGLTEIIVPASVTNVGGASFNGCTNILKYDFTKHTSVPALFNRNAFTSINANCKIYVPDELYDEWIVATNWSNYQSYITKASEMV